MKKEQVTHWCGQWMKHGKREGVYKWFYCRRCNVWEKQRLEWNWAKEALTPSPKQKVLTIVITKAGRPALAEVAQSLATLPNSKSNTRVLLTQSETLQRLAQLHKVEKREAA